MKKLLLTIFACFSLVLTNAQMALNEVYVRPGNGQSEFFEIYNNAKTNIFVNLDCHAVLTYWKDGSSRGWYVLDFPPTAIAPSGYYTAASANPFSTQNNSNITANLDWNNLPAGASLTKWELNGSGTGYNNLGTPANLVNFFEDVNSVNAKNTILVFEGSSFVQGLLTNTSLNSLDASISSMPALTVALPAGTTCQNRTFTFSTGISGSQFLYTVNPAAGNDNGYSRLYDGNCGPWDKSAPGNDHTPNATNNNNGNGGSSPYDGTVVTAQFMVCKTQTSADVVYNITGMTGAATLANSFPVRVQIFNDLGTIGQYDPGVDFQIKDTSISNINLGPFTYTVTGTSTPSVVMLYSTFNGCYDRVFALSASCLSLPVTFMSFTAVRNHSSVILKWETSSERNSSGFAVERNINGGWQQIGFVASQAQGGNSTDILTYQFSDLNNVKGISQYRIKQVDFDNKSKYSEVRSVRGEAQMGSIIVYPNPSMDGKIYVSFEDALITREVSLVDMSGRIIRQWKKIANNNISIDNLTPGLYTLRVFIPATGEQQVQKIVVNKR